MGQNEKLYMQPLPWSAVNLLSLTDSLCCVSSMIYVWTLGESSYEESGVGHASCL